MKRSEHNVNCLKDFQFDQAFFTRYHVNGFCINNGYPPKHMGVAIQVGSIADEIGSAAFFHAFFSTISVRLEPNGWGSRFPLLMRHLYHGELPSGLAAGALVELEEVCSELGRLPPSEVVWDAENRSAKPPWGDNISSDITSLGNYFVSSTGRDLFDLLREALQAASEAGAPARIVQY